MILSEKYYQNNIESLFRNGSIDPFILERRIKIYGKICKYEGALISTNDDGKRKFFREELVELSGEL